MAEYIKRADAMKACQEYRSYCVLTSDVDGQYIADGIEEDIVKIPTADVAEVKHGQWIAQYNGSLKPIYRCSVCNERLIGYSDPSKVRYCHCGAKMDGGKEE